MSPQLVAFGRHLRSAGVRVAAADLLAAAEAARIADLTDRDQFRLALRACLVSQPDHLPIFDRLFDAFFTAPWPAGEAEQGKRKRRGASPRHRPEARPGRGKPLSPTIPGGSSAAQSPAAEPEPGAGRAAREAQRRVTESRVAGLAAAETARRHGQLARLPLDRRLPPEQVQRLEREAERLGRLLRTRHSRRYRAATRGRVDVRATIAAGVRHGGVPFRLVRRVKRVERPRLYVLCDVSGSVIRSARFLLRLLHETQRLFAGTHGDVFVDRPVSAAPLFRQAEFDRALDQLETLPGLDLQAMSDFGHTFIRVLADRHDLLTPTTSVLILGDARCNRFDPQAWALQDIAARVARVVWLNPEQPAKWYTHDSRLRDYQPWITHLLPAATLDDLAEGIDLLCRLR